MDMGQFRKLTAHLGDDAPILLNQASAPEGISAVVNSIAPSADNKYLMINIDVIDDAGRPDEAPPDEAVLELMLDDHTSYYAIARPLLYASLDVARPERYRWLLDRAKPTTVGSDYDVDVTLVHDGDNDEEGWDDYETAVAELEEEDM